MHASVSKLDTNIINYEIELKFKNQIIKLIHNVDYIFLYCKKGESRNVFSII